HRMPTRGGLVSGCAPSGSGQAAVLPMSEMKSRRRIAFLKAQDHATCNLIFGEAVADRHIFTLDIARFLQALKKCATRFGKFPRRCGNQGMHRLLLRLSGQRPCNYRAGEKPDEFPPPHGIYSRGREPPSVSLIRSSSERYAPQQKPVG